MIVHVVVVDAGTMFAAPENAHYRAAACVVRRGLRAPGLRELRRVGGRRRRSGGVDSGIGDG